MTKGTALIHIARVFSEDLPPIGPAPLPDTEPARFWIARYRKSHFWAIYDAGVLVAVTVYRKGAAEVLARLSS